MRAKKKEEQILEQKQAVCCFASNKHFLAFIFHVSDNLVPMYVVVVENIRRDTLTFDSNKKLALSDLGKKTTYSGQGPGNDAGHSRVLSSSTEDRSSEQ